MDGGSRGGPAVIGLILAVVVGILLIGIVRKIAKIAIFLAICVGLAMFAQNKFGSKRLK